MKKENMLVAGLIVLTGAMCFAEWRKGYFVCETCGYRFKPKLSEYLFAPHVLTRRSFNCPYCGEKHWFRKDWDSDMGVSRCVK